MNGQKGSQRDRIISLLFGKKNGKKKKPDEIEEKKDKDKIYYQAKLDDEKEKNDKQEDNLIDVQVDLGVKDSLEEHKKVEQIQNVKPNGEQEIIIEKENEIKPDEKKIVPNIKVDIKPVEDTLQDNTIEIEKTIVETIEQIIKEDLDELEQIEYELKVLNEKQQDEVKLEEVEKLKVELEQIIKKLTIIKDKYYPKKDNKIVNIDDEFIYDLVNDYKDELAEQSLDKKIEKDIKKVKEYINIIERIVLVENDTDDIDKEIDEKLEQYEIRDEEFEKMKDDFTDIEKLKDIVDKFNSEQDSIIGKLEAKIEESSSISRRIETNFNIVPDLNRLIEAAMMIALSKSIPPTPRGKLMKIAMITSAIHVASQFLTTRETTREIVTVKYTDFAKDIKSCIKDISTIDGKIDNAFLDIDTMRNVLIGQYGEFAGKLDEFDNLIKNLDNVEKELKVQKNKVKDYAKEFENVLDKNNVKIKKLEEVRNQSTQN